MASPKRNTSFLNKRQLLDSNLPSELSSCNIKTTPLVKQAWRSSFVPIKAGTVFRRLKRRLRSIPPTCLKWFLLVRGFEAYLTAKKNTKTILLKSKREVQHMTLAFYDQARLIWGPRLESILRKIFSKFIDSNVSLLNETRVQKSQDAEYTRVVFNSQTRRSYWESKEMPG